jgi:hypothetical protein
VLASAVHAAVALGFPKRGGVEFFATLKTPSQKIVASDTGTTQWRDDFGRRPQRDACMTLDEGDIGTGHPYYPPTDEIPAQASEQRDLVRCNTVSHRPEGAVVGTMMLPEGKAAGDTLSVDVWPETNPKMVVSVVVPEGLTAGSFFTAELVAPAPLDGTLACPMYGDLHFDFPAEPPSCRLFKPRLGLEIQVHKRTLTISEVVVGTWAARLNVPSGATITHIAGLKLKGSGQKQVEEFQRHVHERPLQMTVHAPPPPGEKVAKRTFSFSGIKTVPSRSFTRSLYMTPNGPIVIATPSDTPRSESTSSSAASDSSSDRPDQAEAVQFV